MQIPKEDLYLLWVKALIRNDQWQYLMLLADRSTLYGRECIYRDIPGGRVDRGDDILSTLTREILEETWIDDIKIWAAIWTTVSNIRVPYPETDFWLILSLYIANSSTTKIVLSDEHTKYEWCDASTPIERLSNKYPQEFLNQLAQSL